jgi:hypothetical protein
MEIFDFNRCTGELSLTDKFYLDSAWIPWGTACSPNSRFVYAFCSSVILQFDLWATDIKGSMQAVAYASGNSLPFPTDFFSGQLAPDGKIYMVLLNSNTLLILRDEML